MQRSASATSGGRAAARLLLLRHARSTSSVTREVVLGPPSLVLGGPESRDLRIEHVGAAGRGQSLAHSSPHQARPPSRYTHWY
jgi:hypothetical protein